MKNKWAVLSLAAICFIMMAGVANAQTYQGQVIDEFTREPVPYVTVSLQNENNEHIRHTSTDENGYYLLNASEPSDYYVHVKRIGYSENTGGPFFVEADDTLNVIFRIMEISEELGEITVEGTPYEETLIENYLESKNFFARKKRGIGQFMTKEDIEERHALETSELFTGIPGFKRFYQPLAGSPILLNERAKCAPKIIINGLTMNSSTPLTLSGSGGEFMGVDDYVNIDKIVGMEVYTSVVGQPTEFGPKSHCGAVVFWTR